MDDPAPSQTSSHFPLDPVSGLLLFEQETARRDGLKKQGLCRTGSKELDEQVLLGGFERGCIVGVSAEEDEMGLLVSLILLPSFMLSYTSLTPGLRWACKPWHISSWEA